MTTEEEQAIADRVVKTIKGAWNMRTLVGAIAGIFFFATLRSQASDNTKLLAEISTVVKTMNEGQAAVAERVKVVETRLDEHDKSIDRIEEVGTSGRFTDKQAAEMREQIASLAEAEASRVDAVFEAVNARIKSLQTIVNTWRPR